MDVSLHLMQGCFTQICQHIPIELLLVNNDGHFILPLKRISGVTLTRANTISYKVAENDAYFNVQYTSETLVFEIIQQK